jgi:hypothetical protein
MFLLLLALSTPTASALALCLIAGSMFTVSAVVLHFTSDGRRLKSPIVNRFSRRTRNFRVRDSMPEYFNGWFKRELRCCRDSFNIIVTKVEDQWTAVHKPLDCRAIFTIRERVGVTLYHLAHTSTYAQSGDVFGMSKSRAMLYVDQVIQVLITCYRNATIFLPKCANEWKEIEDAFEERYGIPHILGAIDGTLLRVQRYNEHEGWYCRKGFPAFNIQVVVDHKLRFRSYSIRSGSNNDQGVFNKSQFAVDIESLPVEKFFLADAGYKLIPKLMTPYKIYEGMPDDEARYNYTHSRIRMAVERALGVFKGKWKRFAETVPGNNPRNVTKLITAALILHNWLIEEDIGENFDVEQEVVQEEVNHEALMHADERNSDGVLKRDLIKSFIYDNEL